MVQRTAGNPEPGEKNATIIVKWPLAVKNLLHGHTVPRKSFPGRSGGLWTHIPVAAGGTGYYISPSINAGRGRESVF